MTARAGSKNLYFKRDYPKDVRLKPREQFWRSLKSMDPKEAAKQYLVVAGEFNRIIEERVSANKIGGATEAIISSNGLGGLSNDLTPVHQPLKPVQIARISDAHYQSFYDSEFIRRNTIFVQMDKNEEAFWGGAFIEHPYTEFYIYLTSADPWNLSEPPGSERLCDIVLEYCFYYETEQRLKKTQQALLIGNWNDWEKVAHDVLKQYRLVVSDQDRLKLARRLGAAEIKALDDILTNDSRRFDAISDKIKQYDNAQPEIPTAGGPLLSILLPDYLAEGEVGGWPKKTRQRKETILREFMEVAGDKSTKNYSHVDAENFKKIQMRLPAVRKRKAFKGLNLKALGKKADELDTNNPDNKIERLNVQTINDKLSAIGTFFIWANKPGDPVTNPTQGIRIKTSKRKAKKRSPYNDDELKTIFNGKWYETQTWREAPKGLQKPCAKFWIPLIGLYTGMLSGEIIQMRISDVQKKGEIDYFNVTSTDDHENTADEKSLKTANRTRGIPIHTDIVKMGFLDFIKQQKNSKQVRLFPEYKRGSDGSWSRGFSKNYTLYRRNLCNVTRKGLDFYSFRHGMEDALRNADIPYDVRQAIQGREESGVSKEYGTGFYLKTLNDAIQKVKPAVDLSHLFEKT